MRRLLSILLTVCLIMSAVTAWAYWSAGSRTGGNGAAAVSSVNQGSTPTASVAGNAVTVAWIATTLTTGQAVTGYTVKRYSADSTAQTILTACTGTITGTSCVENNVPTGVWTYKVTPVFATNWVGSESAQSNCVGVGNSLGIFTACQDIGAPPIAGSSAYSAGTYTMSGSGADIWNPPDQFQFAYRTMTGDGRLTARVVTDTAAPTNGAAKAGVMIRNSLTTGSVHAMMDLTASNGTEFISRSVDQGWWPYVAATYGLNNPYWVRITRVGNTLMGEYSANGTTWIQQGTTQTITMGSTTYVGLVVTSHDNAASYSATFDNVALTTPPTAVADAYTTNENTTLNVAASGVLANDTDPWGNTLHAVLVSATAGLTLNADGSFAYVPPTNFSGAASFTYKANNGVFDSNTVTVNLTVTASASYLATINGTAGLLSYWRLGEALTSSDSFTGTAGVTIQSRAGEIGATWTKIASPWTDGVLTAEGRVTKLVTNTGGSTYYSSGVPTSADYTVEADIYVASSVIGDAIGLIGRVDTSDAQGTFYLVRYSERNQVFEMFSIVAGQWTWIASSAVYPLTVGSTYRVALNMTGSTIRVLVDGVQVATKVDTTITAAGRGGFALGCDLATSLTDTTGMQLDNFRITPPLADSKGTNNGDYVGGPPLGNAGAIAGDPNTAAQFDGVNDYGTVARQISGDFSIEFWFKSTQNYGSTCTQWWQGAGLVDADFPGLANDFGISLCSGKVIAGVGGATEVSIVTPGTYNDGAWHHVVFTRTQSSGAMALYVDGASAGTATGSVNLLNSQATLNFGRSADGVNYFPGSLDEIAVYTTALSPAIVAAHYNAR